MQLQRFPEFPRCPGSQVLAELSWFPASASGVAQWLACWARDPEVPGSKSGAANYVLVSSAPPSSLQECASPPSSSQAPHETNDLDYRFASLSSSALASPDEFGSSLAGFQSTPCFFPVSWTAPLQISGPVAQWIRHRPTEPRIAGSSPAGFKIYRWKY